MSKPWTPLRVARLDHAAALAKYHQIEEELKTCDDFWHRLELYEDLSSAWHSARKALLEMQRLEEEEKSA